MEDMKENEGINQIKIEKKGEGEFHAESTIDNIISIMNNCLWVLHTTSTNQKEFFIRLTKRIFILRGQNSGLLLKADNIYN